MASPLLHLALVATGLRQAWGGPGPKQQFLLLVTGVLPALALMTFDMH